ARTAAARSPADAAGVGEHSGLYAMGGIKLRPREIPPIPRPLPPQGGKGSKPAVFPSLVLGEGPERSSEGWGENSPLRRSVNKTGGASSAPTSPRLSAPLLLANRQSLTAAFQPPIERAPPPGDLIVLHRDRDRLP